MEVLHHDGDKIRGNNLFSFFNKQSILIIGKDFFLSTVMSLTSFQEDTLSVGVSFSLVTLYTFYTTLYNYIMNYKYILKKNGITMNHFAELLGVSRPTMYKMISDYKDGKLNQEPYISVFNAFFLKERNVMKGNYKMCNGNLMVKIVENTAMNANGTIIKNSETRGKRDVVCGILVVDGSNLKKGDLVYFSYYAGQPMQLEDGTVYIVNYKDVKFINKGANNED